MLSTVTSRAVSLRAAPSRAPRSAGSTPRPRAPRAIGALAASLALIASLAACSPAASPAPEGSTTTGSSGQNTGGDANFSADRDAYDLKLAECLRGKGLDVKDPQPGKGIQESSDEIIAAVPACMDEIGDPPVSGGALSDAAQLEIWLKEVDCFRKLGYEVEEPGVQRAYTLPAGASDEELASCLVS